MLPPTPSKSKSRRPPNGAAKRWAHSILTGFLLAVLMYTQFSGLTPKPPNDDSSNHRNSALDLLHRYSESLGMLTPNISQPWTGNNKDGEEIEWGAVNRNVLYRGGEEGSCQKKLTKSQTTIFQKAKQLVAQHMHSNIAITGSWIALNGWDRRDFLMLVEEQAPSSPISNTQRLVHVPYRGGFFAQPRTSVEIKHTPIAVLTAFACRLETLENFLDITIAALEGVKGNKRLVLTILNCIQSSKSTSRDPVSKWSVSHMIKTYKKKHKKLRSKHSNSKNNKNKKHKKNRMTSPVDFQVIFLNQPFSRSVGLNRGAEELNKNEIAVVLDVDMRVSTQFFTHCRTFTTQSLTYFPIPFVRLRPTEMNQEKIQVEIRKNVGSWDTSSHNSFAISSNDLRRIGKKGALLFNADISKSWGMEVEDLIDSLTSNGLRVMRMYDPTLIHHYHKTDCGNVKGKICLGSAKLLGSNAKLTSHWD